jgi:PAP2 superfamily
LNDRSQSHAPSEEKPSWRHPRSWRLTRSLAIRLGLSLALIIVSYFSNRSFLVWGLFVIFALLVVPGGRGKSFAFSFVPYAAIWFVFTAGRSLADETILARTINTKVAALERWLFGGQLPTIIMQDRFFDPSNLHWWDYALTGVHWSYFIAPHAVAIYTWYTNPTFFRQYLTAMGLLMANGLCIYFLIPANPPWMAPEACNSPACPTPERIMTTIAEQLGGGLYNASYRVVGESNPIAAMPSMHMAATFLIVFPAFAVGRRWGILALIYSGFMGLALMYLGEHYFVDILAGCLVTTYAWYATAVWLRRVAPAMARGGLASSAPQPAPEIASNPA